MEDEEKKEGEEKELEVNDGFFQAPEIDFNIPNQHGGEEGDKKK